MRAVTKLLVMSLAFAIPACIPSLQPLYTDSDKSFDPAIVGVWVQDSKDSTWVFAKKDNAYRLVYRDKEGRPGVFQARLVKLDKQSFLDLFPDEPNLSENAYYKFHLLRVHTFLKVAVDGSQMQLAGMDPNWLKRLLESNPKAVRHETIDDTIVFTAAPRELQRFLRNHSNDDGAFGAVIHLNRVDSTE